jgi:glutaredoxin
VKEFLSRAGRTFDVKVVDEDDAAYDALLRMGYRTVPVTVVGNVVVQGFDRDALAKALAAAG